MKKAFTLAEVMIVLTVIGILSAILVPVAFQSAPDKNVMKFKKANSILGTVIRELVSSDQYFKDGNMTYLANGSASTSVNLCSYMADVMNYKTSTCSNTNSTADSANPDTDCSGTKKAQITTPDDVVWFLASNTAYGSTEYKTICFDVDGIGVGQAPFGYRVRRDGKIIYGSNAKSWTTKSVQKGD